MEDALKRISVFLCFALFTLTLTALAQDDFSADLYNTKSGNDMTIQAKLYITKDKMRVEPQGEQAGHGLVIMNFATATTDVLMPERKMYMEMNQAQSPMRRSYSFFRPGDVDNACGDWQKMATRPGGTCKKIASETVNGRKTVHYQGTSADGATGDVWIDSDLRFPVKWQDKGNAGELRNIKVGSQSSSLFEIPSDYQKMQMPMGMPGGMPPNMQHP
jgi:hypothetical protein